ncbi:MAG: PAS domain S-box protein, partial [Ignavibacteria bacterium]|nr:PAS domain S-box protein [Ignavibacteria bacterium]
MIVVMTIDEWVKDLLFPNASEWESNLINIISASILAAIVSLFLSRNYEKNLQKHRTEIAARKKAEEDLNETLSILQATLESTIDAILVVSQERKVVIYNQKFIELWNIPKNIIDTNDDKQLLECVLSQLKDPEEFLRKVEELYQSPEQISFDVIEFKDGRFFERYSQPQKLGKDIRGRVWSFEDITEKKKDELRIKESEARFKSIWKGSRDGFRLTDEKGIVLMANDAYFNFVGKTEKEIIDKPFYIVYNGSTHQSSIEKYKERFEKKEFEEALL